MTSSKLNGYLILVFCSKYGYSVLDNQQQIKLQLSIILEDKTLKVCH